MGSIEVNINSDSIKIKEQKSPKVLESRFQMDRIANTNKNENKRRRTLLFKRNKLDASWGFTIQSYGIHHKNTNELEFLTYIDYVELRTPAHYSGLRMGDVILSIDGMDFSDVDDPEDLVRFIKTRAYSMRMVVLFENCVKKVELHLRRIKLEKLLKEKEMELQYLQNFENEIISRNLWNKASTLDGLERSKSALYIERMNRQNRKHEESLVHSTPNENLMKNHTKSTDFLGDDFKSNKNVPKLMSYSKRHSNAACLVNSYSLDSSQSSVIFDCSEMDLETPM